MTASAPLFGAEPEPGLTVAELQRRIAGKRQTISQWSDELGIDRRVIAARYKAGFSPERILQRGDLRKGRVMPRRRAA